MPLNLEANFSSLFGILITEKLKNHSFIIKTILEYNFDHINYIFYYQMITDSQIFTALMVALTAAILAIGLGRQLYI
tara:strand:- start:486 stop:716 length:231 start_codon:yes stop_codon:yes gene_type:complete